MITLEDYFGRMSLASAEEPSETVKENAALLLERVNALLSEIPGIEAASSPVINSGWRAEGYNARVIGASPTSKHITGEAIDLADRGDALDAFLNQNQDLLEKYRLWMENPIATPSWCHLQSQPPRSGRRVFMP